MKKLKRKLKGKVSGNTYVVVALFFLFILIIALGYIIYKDSTTYYYEEPDTPYCGPNMVCYKSGLSCAKPAFDPEAAAKCISLELQLKSGDTCWLIWLGQEWSPPICPD